MFVNAPWLPFYSIQEPGTTCLTHAGTGLCEEQFDLCKMFSTFPQRFTVQEAAEQWNIICHSQILLGTFEFGSTEDTSSQLLYTNVHDRLSPRLIYKQSWKILKLKFSTQQKSWRNWQHAHILYRTIYPFPKHVVFYSLYLSLQPSLGNSKRENMPAASHQLKNRGSES